ncbi:hypothetical protein Lal_00015566 [Lupinus albus]|nr:hypothetical protein Lal_00015566 [Lupinus albus]
MEEPALTPCPIRSSSLTPLTIFSSTGRVNSKVPYSGSGCKAEPEEGGERMGTAPPAARVFDPKGIENETRICVHYLWSGVTILNLLFPISPLPFFLFLAGSSRALFLIRCISVLKARPTDRSSYLYCLSNPKILIRGGVLRVGSDPIPAVKVLPDPAHLPLKLECLYRGGYPRNR